MESTLKKPMESSKPWFAKRHLTPEDTLPATPVLPNPVLDLAASTHRIAKVSKKKKTSKPPKSPLSFSKRKRTLEAGGTFGVKNTTTAEEVGSFRLKETVLAKATMPPSGSVPPPVEQMPVIMKYDDETTDDEPLVKRQKTSTPPPKSSSNPTASFGQEDFDRIFNKTGSSTYLAPPMNTSGFAHLLIPERISKSSRPPKNYATSRSKLIKVFPTLSVDLKRMRTATVAPIFDLLGQSGAQRIR
ncbi:hypothetical protein K7X08_030496 [Anisodus acutangulus]|uniref:Uncharacterized protein n=1 Tax=Anisodus acutangulus TaxID=402998 RepID=A0A9Q1QXC8_9SOLA|nr:hypothetical protein K7X08_030496 [Anisodus acutangulus]